MASCIPSDLVTAARCFVCLDARQQQAVRVRLLCAIVNKETMSCDPKTLMAQAACFNCGLDAAQLGAIEISLLCQIASGGGGGGGVTSGAANPSGAPTGGNGVYYNTSNSSFWVWDSSLSQWVPLIL